MSYKQIMKNQHNRIAGLLMIALGVLMMSGCSQVNNVVNSNTAASNQANTNTANIIATNTNTANTNTANTNTEAAKSSSNLLGTWVGDDPKNKVVFTENEMTLFYDGQEQKGTYKSLGEQAIEFTDAATGNNYQVKATVEGDNLTLTRNNRELKFKRESADTAANADNQSTTAGKSSDSPCEPPDFTKVSREDLNKKIEDNDRTIYQVVVDFEERYSICPVGKTLPSGWLEVRKTGTKQECFEYIAEVWTDRRPLSVRIKENEMRNNE